MIQLEQETYERTCAFVRTMVAACRSCLRPKSACSDCDLFMSRYILDCLLDAQSPIQKQRFRSGPPSFKTRSDFYLDIIRSAGRYLTAREIDPKNELCGRGLKYNTLRRMVKFGILKTYCDGSKTYFGTTNKDTQHEHQRPNPRLDTETQQVHNGESRQ